MRPATHPWTGLANLGLPLLAISGLVAIVTGLGLNASAPNSHPFLNPPDGLVPAVWITLFVLMGYARYLVIYANHQTSARIARFLVFYMLFCLSYPVYTLGLSSDVLGLIGNAATFTFAALLIVMLWPVSPAAGLCIAPVLPWLVYASLTMLLTQS